MRNLLRVVLMGLGLLLISMLGLRLWYPFPYQDLIVPVSEEVGISPHLVAALIREESRFRPEALSPKGAMGLMQIMPTTGAWIWEQLEDSAFSEAVLSLPEHNIRMGVWYLHYLVEYFDGEKLPAIAAYNGGMSRVRGWLERDLWDGTPKEVPQIPAPETRVFVERVLTSYDRYRMLYPGIQRGRRTDEPR